MRTRVLGAVVTLVVVAACGGVAPTPVPTLPPQPSPTPTANLVQTAVDTLESQHNSWQFTTTTYESGSPTFSRLIKGTQAPKSPSGLSFVITTPNKPSMKYVRLGNDVWFDSGTGSFTQSKADDNYVNLAFQQFYLDNLLTAVETPGFEFNSVGDEDVGGIAATHYRLADPYVQSLLGSSGLTPADWGADAWISDADGSLLRLTWGPQSVDKAQAQPGFDYTVTAVDCNCPIKPPTTGTS
jgi:hypothetical protein